MQLLKKMQISMFREGETFRLVFGGKQLKGRQCATIYGKKKTKHTQPGSYVRMCCNTHDAGGRHRRAAVSLAGGGLRSRGAIALSFELRSPCITRLKIDYQMQRGTLKPKKRPSENW